MRYDDTLFFIDDLAGLNPRRFGVVVLRNYLSNVYGPAIFNAQRVLPVGARGNVVRPRLQKRLIVLVDQGEREPETAAKARAALGIAGNDQDSHSITSGRAQE